MVFEIDEDLIRKTDAIKKTYHKGDVIVQEGFLSPYFFYLLNGEVSVFNYTEDGKEFLQHKILENHFFGEPAVLLEQPFPGTVEVTHGSAEILKVERSRFLEYLYNHPDQMMEFCKSVSDKAVVKSKGLKNLVFLKPEERILKQLQEYKRQHQTETEPVTILLTRREISSMTGLRVETVIRAVKKMEKNGQLKIKNGKIII